MGLGFSTTPTIPLIILVIVLYSFLLLFLINPTFLFSLFLNDIDTFLENKNITGLQTISDEIENNIDIYQRVQVFPLSDSICTLKVF
jgi:hypothetical protein